MKHEEKLNEIARLYDPSKDFDGYLLRLNFRTMMPFIKGKTCLEVGCARGMSTLLLTNLFETVHVVEPSRFNIEAARKKVGKRAVFFHSFCETFSPPIRYDAIFLLRLLEHLENPVAALRRVKTWLNPDGLIHIIVPNATSLHRRIGVYMGMLESLHSFSERDRKFGHRCVYDFNTLQQDIEKAELRVLHKEGVFLKPLPNAQLMSWKQEILDALYAVGKEVPELCAEIYMVAAL